jgi:hypothetical protein
MATAESTAALFLWELTNEGCWVEELRKKRLALRRLTAN